jgi:transcriptional regulator with XRE-family HTH domain
LPATSGRGRVAAVSNPDPDESLDDWQRKADELEHDLPKVGGYPIPGLLRRARRLADLSQRQLAVRARVSQSTVARIESGDLTPSLNMFHQLLAAAGLHLVVVDGRGRVVLPIRESEETRDGAGRRYPSHLDTILDPRPGEWWADWYGLARPPETFRRNRYLRDQLRERSRWEVRVGMLRAAPEPPLPGADEARAAAWRARREQFLAGTLKPADVDPNDFDVDE